jgi:ankyrin repeat protein
MLAVEKGNCEVVKLLVDAGADREKCDYVSTQFAPYNDRE